MSYAKLEALANDKVILRRMDDVYSKFRTYMDVKPDSKRPSVAYFSMEYGLSHVLKIYSGGLGVLAGDYLKEASDSNADLCAIGFLYRYGYFTQTLSMDGQQKYGVLSHFFPESRVKVSEQFGGFIIPCPPDVMCQFRQFLQFGGNVRFHIHIFPVRSVYITNFNLHCMITN